MGEEGGRISVPHGHKVSVSQMKKFWRCEYTELYGTVHLKMGGETERERERKEREGSEKGRKREKEGIKFTLVLRKYIHFP